MQYRKPEDFFGENFGLFYFSIMVGSIPTVHVFDIPLHVIVKSVFA